MALKTFVVSLVLTALFGVASYAFLGMEEETNLPFSTKALLYLLLLCTPVAAYISNTLPHWCQR